MENEREGELQAMYIDRGIHAVTSASWLEARVDFSNSARDSGSCELLRPGCHVYHNANDANPEHGLSLGAYHEWSRKMDTSDVAT
jgi:hypothetical protein